MAKNDPCELQRCGYLKCKIDMTEILLRQENLLFSKMKQLRAKIEAETSLLKKKDFINELCALEGESRSLRFVTAHVASLEPKYPDPGGNGRLA